MLGCEAFGFNLLGKRRMIRVINLSAGYRMIKSRRERRQGELLERE